MAMADLKDAAHDLVENQPLIALPMILPSPTRAQRKSRYVFGVYVLLLSSLGCNLFLLAFNRATEGASAFGKNFKLHSIDADRREAGLTFDTSMPDERGDPYNSQNESLAEQAWSEIPWDAGEIVLDHSYAADKGLPPAQPWVWDHSKGVYFINAHHGLHCLVRFELPRLFYEVNMSTQQLMRQTYITLLAGQAPSYDSEHILHCFNALRQDIMCNADDTPRYTGFEHPGTVGYGQPRICRSWKKLQRWAIDRSACWRNINPTEDISELLRFRYCPDGRKWDPVRERIQSIWGHVDQGKGASKDT